MFQLKDFIILLIDTSALCPDLQVFSQYSVVHETTRLPR